MNDSFLSPPGRAWPDLATRVLGTYAAVETALGNSTRVGKVAVVRPPAAPPTS